MATLQIVDDEPELLATYVRERVGDMFDKIIVSETGADALAQAVQAQPNVVLLDVGLPDISGLEVLERLHELNAHCPVIMITAATTTDTAIDAIKRGAFDYLLKPPNYDQLRTVVERALEMNRQMDVPAVLTETVPIDERSDVIIARCQAMLEVFKAIGRVANQDVTVLITGESGTGKELVARAIYQHSQRASRPFHVINCAAIPDTLLESELFGHEQGAFTGAHRRRIGKFEQCSGGTLFLDEIGELSPLTQGKLLRVLQDQQFERVGGNELIKTDVRIVTATNKDLEQLVKEDRFRGDLFYRLRGYNIHLPPLRHRKGDLALLVEYYLRRISLATKKNVVRAASDVMHLLSQHTWPGNVRELQNVLQEAVLHSAGDVLTLDSLPTYIHGTDAGSPPESAAQNDGPDLAAFIRERLSVDTTDLYQEVIQLAEKQLLGEVLQFTNGNQLRAAQILGITRRTLRTKLRLLGLKITLSLGESAS